MVTEEDTFVNARLQMVHGQLRSRGVESEQVLQAFAQVPRERFVPPDMVAEAYADQPIPIGFGQTISQPFVVALMVQELRPHLFSRILDVGAGSGYQTAILARLARHVYAVERIDELSERAASLLAALNVRNVTFYTGDGSMGWPEEAPFDGIICGAAAPDVPGPWIDQLADGGRIILPVGGADAQVLTVVEKSGGQIRRRSFGDARFVKLVGRAGWPE